MILITVPFTVPHIPLYNDINCGDNKYYAARLLKLRSATISALFGVGLLSFLPFRPRA